MPVQITGQPPVVSMTSSGDPKYLPMHERHAALRFVSADGQSGTVAYPVNFDEVGDLQGMLMTLTDATFADPQQRKAQKDMIRHTLRLWMDGIIIASGDVRDFDPRNGSDDESKP